MNLYIPGESIDLKTLRPSDVGERYCGWLNDPEINQYLESRFENWTVTRLKKYVRSINASGDNLFFAITVKSSGEYIGNIKLGQINRYHSSADIGIIIGEKSSWGKGFATEAIRLLKDHAFNVLKIHKLTAGAYAANVGSVKAFQKAGFSIEGVRKEQYECHGRHVDAVLLGCARTSRTVRKPK